MDKQEYDSLTDSLVREAVRERDESEITKIYMGMMVTSFVEKDASFVPPVARGIVKKLLREGQISANEKLWLINLLSNLISDKDAAMRAVGANSSGAPKNGHKALLVAFEVLAEIEECGATTVQQAWEKTAERMHLSVETVRKYWTQSKEIVIDHVATELYPKGVPGGDLVKLFTKRNREFQRRIDF